MAYQPSDTNLPASSGFIEGFVRSHPRRVLETLLCDRTSGRNIVWADDEYAELGDGYAGEDELSVELVTGPRSGVIKPRVAKEQERQSLRTKSRAEVFTPSWLCNLMNNRLDEEWFRRPGTFNLETEVGWEPNPEPVKFPKTKGRGWHAYVTSPRLEITCGEAPFLCSRYDAANGAPIPVGARVGILDRKLRVVDERAANREAWVKWALAALRATYGYEYQGDNLLIARINVLETFVEHHRERWGCDPMSSEIDQAAWIVSWNLWQMNGLTCAPPTKDDGATPQSTLPGFEEPAPQPVQMSLFDAFGLDVPEQGSEPQSVLPLCIIYDWDSGELVEFASLRSKVRTTMKKFYAVIGNPPYQVEPELGSTRSLPIYDKFMDEAYKVSDKVELITPARFLFNSGQTSSTWNEKMLSDEHLKVLFYEPDSGKLFSGVDIKGGVAVTYHDATAHFEPIGMFIPIPQLSSMVEKVNSASVSSNLYDISGTQCNYNFAELYKDHPEYREFISGEGRHSQLKSNALEKVPIFSETKQHSDDIRILGLVARERVYRYCPRRYIDLTNQSLMTYKVIVPASNGSGTFGETLSTPVVGEPGTGFTQTFMCIGKFPSLDEANGALKYIKTKFSRALLGVLKNTQHNPPITWRLIPTQDFTPNSDIDWSRPIPEIDRQLYRKYRLSDDEVEFIESHVKEMS